MDPLLIQKGIKDNAEDLATYLRDLKNWETDIKKKDAELRGVDPVEHQYPEIRSKKKNAEPDKTLKKKKTSGCDWDRHDENLFKGKDSNEEEEYKKSAMLEKEKGNYHFKAGNLEKAISCYTSAIKAYPGNAIFFANRGLCYLLMEDFHKAVSDCTEAISVDCSYVKAWLRRAAAYEALGKLESAKGDLKRVISLEPRNDEANRKLESIERRIENEKPKKEDEEMGKESGGSDSGHEITAEESCKVSVPWKDYKGEIIKPIKKPPHLRSKKPLRRVPIEVVLGIESDSTTEKKSPPVTSSVSQGNLDASEPAPSELPPPPRSSVQFLMNWKKIKMDPDMALSYLKQIPPQSLPSLFGDSLEISILEEMLNVLGQNISRSAPGSTSLENPNSQDGHSTYDFLKNLSKVPRFSTLSMFLNPEEQKVFRLLLEHCVENGECSKGEAADLAKKFML